jgi:hypothetical protein
MLEQAEKLRQVVRRKRLWNEHVSTMEEVSINPLSWEDFKRVYRDDTSDTLLLQRAVRLVSKRSHEQAIEALRLKDEERSQHILPRKGKYGA